MDYAKLNAELETYDLELDFDPVKNGIGSISSKIASVEKVLDRLAQILSDAITNHGNCEENFKMANNEYSIKLSGLLIEDKEVKEQKSQEMRKAFADTKYLKEDVKTINQREVEFSRAKSFKENASMYYERWNKKAKSIDSQLDVIREQIKIGEITEEYIKSIMAGKILKLKNKE